MGHAAGGRGDAGDAHYSRAAIAFHWIIAALLVANLLLGLYHEDVGREARSWMMFFHKADGLLIFGLTLARLAWRMTHRPPPLDPVMRPWERVLARSTHALFYVLLIAIPLTGWIMSSSSGRAVDFYGLFDIAPLPVPAGEGFHDSFEEAHELLGKLMIGLIALHVAGALKHHLEGHRHLIGRMAPWLYGG